MLYIANIKTCLESLISNDIENQLSRVSTILDKCLSLW